MVHLDILRDNREQTGWDFDNHPATVHGETLSTGDYTLARLCNHDEIRDTYHPKYAIERKSGEDFVSSITHDRSRFKEEIKRASAWDEPLWVLVEAPRTLFKRQRGFMQYRDVAPSQIFGTVDSWEEGYNVEFGFVGTRENAQAVAFDALACRLASSLVSSD
jgi:ERCC4-type nuclease